MIIKQILNLQESVFFAIFAPCINWALRSADKDEDK